MGQQYQGSDAASSNYAIGPGGNNMNHGLNQQATSFTPRTANFGRGQGRGHGGQRQHHQLQNGNGNVNGNSNGHTTTGQDPEFESIEDQMRRFNLNQRPQ
jgi:hypothetical protein